MTAPLLTDAKPRINYRNALISLARMQINGELDQACDHFMADSIRAFAPALRGEQEHTVLFSWFEELCAAIAQVDGCEDGSLSWCEVLGDASGNDLDGQALTAAQEKLTDTLDKLTTPGGLS